MRLTQFIFPDDHLETFKIKEMTSTEFVESLDFSLRQEKNEIFKDKFKGLVRQDYFKVERKGIFREEIAAIGKWTQENNDLIVNIEYRQNKLRKWLPNVILLFGVIIVTIEGIKGAVDLRYTLAIIIFIFVLFGGKNFSRDIEIEKIRKRIKEVFENKLLVDH